jgi:hypothetical protein
VKADNGRHGGEGADAENEEESDLLSARALDRVECLDGDDYDPDVGYDVEARRGWA